MKAVIRRKGVGQPVQSGKTGRDGERRRLPPGAALPRANGEGGLARAVSEAVGKRDGSGGDHKPSRHNSTAGSASDLAAAATEPANSAVVASSAGPAGRGEARLPVFLRGEQVSEAVVDHDEAERLGEFRWILDSTRGCAYRVEKRDGSPPVHITLQREVFGLKPGDPRTVSFRDENRLNCRRDNLYEGVTRDLSFIRRPENAAQWPLKPENLLNFYKKRNERRMVALLEGAEFERYGRRAIVLRYESDADGTKEALLATSQTHIKEKLATDFGFRGELSSYASALPAALGAKGAAPEGSMGQVAAPSGSEAALHQGAPLGSLAAMSLQPPAKMPAGVPAGQPAAEQGLASLGEAEVRRLIEAMVTMAKTPGVEVNISFKLRG